MSPWPSAGQVVLVSLILGMTVGGPIAKLTRKFIELLSFGCFCKADPMNPERRFVPPYTDSKSSSPWLPTLPCAFLAAGRLWWWTVDPAVCCLDFVVFLKREVRTLLLLLHHLLLLFCLGHVAWRHFLFLLLFH